MNKIGSILLNRKQMKGLFMLYRDWYQVKREAKSNTQSFRRTKFQTGLIFIFFIRHVIFIFIFLLIFIFFLLKYKNPHS